MKLKHLYIALGLSALLTSCKDDEPVVNPTRDLVEIPVSFTIKLNSESRDTRADGDTGLWVTDTDDDGNPTQEGNGDTDPGTDFDNTINSVTPVLYLASKYGSNYTIDPDYPVAELEGKTLRNASISNTLDPTTKKPIAGSFDISGTMICSGLTPSQLLEYQDRLRLAVFINCASGDVMNPLVASKPAQATFNHHGQPDDHRDTGSEHFHGIPMYGVTGVKFFKETDGDRDVYKVYAPGSTEVNKKQVVIPILRSMAKIRVLLKTDDNGDVIQDLADKEVKLTELYISRHAVKGYVVPKGWNTVSDVTSLNNLGKGLNPFFGSTNSAADDGYYNHNCSVYPKDSDKAPEIGDGYKDEEKYPDYFKNTSELLRLYLPDTYNEAHDGDSNSDEIYLEIKYTIKGVYEADGQTLKEFKHPLWLRPMAEWPRADATKTEYDVDGNPTYPVSDNAPWDIIRNHIYEFVIEGVEATTGALTVNVKVNQWNDHDNVKIKY